LAEEKTLGEGESAGECQPCVIEVRRGTNEDSGLGIGRTFAVAIVDVLLSLPRGLEKDRRSCWVSRPTQCSNVVRAMKPPKIILGAQTRRHWCTGDEADFKPHSSAK
jgi:hypothetical protein